MIKLRVTAKHCSMAIGRLIVLAPVLILGACATVDLTQASLNTSEQSAVKPQQNVVKQASQKLTSLFTSKGWCKDTKTASSQSAASVLLRGRKSDENTAVKFDDIANDIAVATNHIHQTTKAAEVFLVMAEDHYDMSQELSVLETALLSAHQAQANFKAAPNSSTSKYKGDFNNFQNSLTALQRITDQYGARIRQNIVTDVTLENTKQSKS